ncbi:MAG: sulfotransferase [Cyclobacteriaceae bacterium]
MYKSIILLSEKSSGSSAFQQLLSAVQEVKHIRSTRHFENESLYWTKAASILQMPQLKMVDSEVPLSRKKAIRDLRELLDYNLENFNPPQDDKSLIFEGWKQLCKEHQPIFFEKSPHHLCQWSALSLIMEFMQSNSEVDTLLVGLIRNPMDTIYSQYKRWKTHPEKVEKQWITSYSNLLKLKEVMGEKLYIIRYEDLISSVDYLIPVLDFCGIDQQSVDAKYFHGKSLQKWKNDSFFGFTLSEEALSLASQFGYTKDSLTNTTYFLWPVTWGVMRVFHKLISPLRYLMRA